MDGIALLRTARIILLIDWPSRAVPDGLTRLGLQVISADGPDTYNAYELEGDAVRLRRVDGPPKRADIVYAYRPFEELPDVLAAAKQANARAVWVEGLAVEQVAPAAALAEAAGVLLVTEPRISEAARMASRPQDADEVSA